MHATDIVGYTFAADEFHPKSQQPTNAGGSMRADRSIAVPASYYDEHDAVLELFSPDGERGDMQLSVDGCVLARGEGFRPASFGPSLLEQTDAQLAGMFGAFLAHALESGEDDGWSILGDDARAWTDALYMMGEECDA